MAQIHEAINAIMLETDAIAKSRKNQQQGYAFRGIEDVYNTMHPLFAKHGVFITTEVVNAIREERRTKADTALYVSIIDYRFAFHAKDGSSVTTVIRGEGMDSADKASNKAASVALKYAIFQMFLIPTEDLEDPDRTTPPATQPPAKPQAQVEPPKQPQGNLTQFQNKYNAVKTLDELRAVVAEQQKFTWTEDHKGFLRDYWTAASERVKAGVPATFADAEKLLRMAPDRTALRARLAAVKLGKNWTDDEQTKFDIVFGEVDEAMAAKEEKAS